MTMWPENMATAKTILSTVASVAAASMVIRSIINDVIPQEVHHYFYTTIKSFFNHRFTSNITITIDEFDGIETNHLFEAAELYLGSNLSSSSSFARRLRVTKPESEKSIRVAVDKGEELVDVFNGAKFNWVLQCQQIEAQNYYNPRDMNSTLKTEVRFFNLVFHQRYKTMVVEKYLPHILKQAELVKQATKTIKLYTADYNVWNSIGLNHPATFETLAMDSDLKRVIIDDIERFVRRKEYYRRVGKAWKRGYLLHGPPGTGKSSLIAAMANYLNFDIYDLQLSGLNSDSELRNLMVGTNNRSILVVEDIDCSIQFKERDGADGDRTSPATNGDKQVTLSGLLNFIDGLWSSCGDERIIIFTTNHKDKLDPALLRPGRMDMHINMSYCTPCGFKVLANNYLGIKHHQLFEEIENLIQEVQATPAEVAERLMKHDDPEPALKGLIDFLKLAKVENTKDKSNELKPDIKFKEDDQNEKHDENTANSLQSQEIL